MRIALRWFVIILVTLHGLIHLLGAAKGLDWATVDQLKEPISMPLGIAWLAAAAAVLTSAAMLVLRAPHWWQVTAVAALASQAVILTSWDDANAGTVANLIMLLAAGYGYAAEGSSSFRAQYRRMMASVLADPAPTAFVTEDDLARLPAAVAEYVRRSGAVGRPRVNSFHAILRGRIRAAPDKPWMRFTGQQANTYGPNPSRLFFMDATMTGLPVDILHTFSDRRATMRGRLCSLVTIIDASGKTLTRAETVTLFNDLCVMAPAALVDAPVSWQVLDEHRTRGAFTVGQETIRADLIFNEAHDLVDFVSDDRLRNASDGKSFTPLRWSTPLSDYQTFDSRRVARRGQGHWHAPAPEGRFAYLEIQIDDIRYNVGSPTWTSTSRIEQTVTATAPHVPGVRDELQ